VEHHQPVNPFIVARWVYPQNPIADVDYAKAAGIPLKNATKRQPTPIDPAWLREQYVTRCRSFPDIAAELGLADMIVTRAAHRLGIPVRAPGVTSQACMIAVLDDRYPPDIRAAVEGQLHG
jgi:hypothetical protein